jgi:uncharacterized membrane protein YfcA
MRKTTGELKLFLTPDNIVKGLSIIFVLLITAALAILQILNGEVVGTILAGIIGYTLGTRFNSEKNSSSV